MKIKFLMGLSVLMFVLGGCAHAPQEHAAAPQVLVIDVRTEQEIAAVALDKKTRIYLYCRTGRRTGLAFDVLKKAAYEDLINLSTMENASKELNLPIVE